MPVASLEPDRPGALSNQPRSARSACRPSTSTSILRAVRAPKRMGSPTPSPGPPIGPFGSWGRARWARWWKRSASWLAARSPAVPAMAAGLSPTRGWWSSSFMAYALPGVRPSAGRRRGPRPCGCRTLCGIHPAFGRGAARKQVRPHLPWRSGQGSCRSRPRSRWRSCRPGRVRRLRASRRPRP